MFVMVSPLQNHLSETLTSLKFATKVWLYLVVPYTEADRSIGTQYAHWNSQKADQVVDGEQSLMIATGRSLAVIMYILTVPH